VTGIVAVLQAEAGMTGPLDVLDHADHYDSHAMIGRLGSDPYTAKTYFKLYSCCRHIHAPVDALRALIERHGLAPDQIEAVEVHTYRGALRLSNRAEPAIWSTCSTVSLLPGPGGDPGTVRAAAFDQGRPVSRRRFAIRQEGDAAPRFGARRSVSGRDADARGRTRGCQRYESTITAPRGEATDPLSWRELKKNS